MQATKAVAVALVVQATKAVAVALVGLDGEGRERGGARRPCKREQCRRQLELRTKGQIERSLAQTALSPPPPIVLALAQSYD